MALRCEEVRDRFSALWEKELTPPEEAEVMGHVAACPECEREYARFDRTLRTLHTVEEVDVPEGFLAGIHQKIEERSGRSGSPDKAAHKWFPFPMKWNLPVQAVAMVAVVFLALYLTQRTPEESIRMKVADERQAPVSEEKGAQVALLPRAESPAPKPPSKEREGKRVPKRPDEATVDEKVSGEPKGVIAPASPRLNEAEPARTSLLKMKASEGTGAMKDAGPIGLEPSQQIILKSPDPEGMMPRVLGLVRQFNGETLTTEGNTLLISMPASSLPEFRRHLEAARVQGKKRELAPDQEQKIGSIAESVQERREARKRERDMPQPDTLKEERTIVRIVVERE